MKQMDRIILLLFILAILAILYWKYNDIRNITSERPIESDHSNDMVSLLETDSLFNDSISENLESKSLSSTSLFSDEQN